MNAKPSMRTSLAVAIRKQLELGAKTDSTELQVALENLAEDVATLYARRLAGESVELESEAVKARVAVLKSASVLSGVEAVRDALWQALASTFHEVSEGLRR